LSALLTKFFTFNKTGDFGSVKETQAGYRNARWVFNIPESAKKLRLSRRE
jgi:hypothetical protein